MTLNTKPGKVVPRAARPVGTTDPAPLPGEIQEESQLRPLALDDFVGQSAVKEQLKIFLAAARQRGEAMDHVLFHGPPGLGKTTLASIVAHELGVEITHTSGPVIERAGDLAGLLTNIGPRGVLFVDEIHRLSPVVEEYLYPALEDFTLVGATTRSGLLSSPLRARFGMTLRLDYYGAEDLARIVTRSGLLSSPLRARFGVTLRLDYYAAADLVHIVRRSAKILGVEIADAAAHEIARRSRGTPRIANRLLRRVRDVALVTSDGRITMEVTRDALRLLAVDERGLDEMDRRLLDALISRYQGGPVGLSTLAVVVGEEAGTLEDVYEPFLVQEGLIKRTPRGREATPLAYAHLGVAPPQPAASVPESPKRPTARPEQPELPLP